MTNTHTRSFTAGPEHIDELGHVNNAVWVNYPNGSCGWEVKGMSDDQFRHKMLETFCGEAIPGDPHSAGIVTVE